MVLVPAAMPYWDGKALIYALLSLTVIRMVSVVISLIGTGMGLPAISLIGWFGPRGIASVLYLVILIGELGPKADRRMLAVIILTVLLSVFIHGLSAVPLSNAYGRYVARIGKSDKPAR